jgi:hypothetical protein
LRHLGSADRAALETMLEASVNRLLHLPTTRLRQAASLESLEAPGFSELATVLTTLFALAEGDIEGADLDESGLDAPEQAPESSDSRDVAKLGSR